jgi:hypothetical protein
MRYAEHVSHTRAMKNISTILFGKPKGKRQLGIYTCGWGNNIKICVKGIGCEDVNWILMVQGKVQWRELVNTVMILQVP